MTANLGSESIRRASSRSLGRALGLSLLPVLLGSLSCSKHEPGEVIVVVTTDMALPADLDRLDWTVTRLSHPELAPEQGSFALDHWNALPATLAIVAEQGEERVSVSLDGRLVSEKGALRVHKEEQLTVPASGQKMLQIPLDWLCSDALLSQPCDPNSACRAGQCVSAPSDLPLADYVPIQPAPCFDVQKCTLVGSNKNTALPNLVMLDPMAQTQACIIDSKEIPSGLLSVALVVNPATAGNAGVCSPNDVQSPDSGLCFVPLNQDNTLDGWQFAKDAQRRTVIRLPVKVCDAVAQGRVENVALTGSSECGVKTSERPLCDADSVCVQSPSSCPDTFPASWSGYSCSNDAVPSDPSLTYCPVADTDPALGPVVRGHLCCTAGQAASTDPLLIDDMSGGSLIKLPHPPDEFAGNWFTSTDDPDSPLSPPQGHQTLFTYRAVPPVTPAGGPTIDSAACFQMIDGFSGTYALEGFSFFSKGSQAVPLDVSQYKGMTFWATLSALGPQDPALIRVVFPNADTDTVHDSSCIQAGLGKTNCNHFGLDLTGLSGDWQQFSVTWDELTQSPGFGQPFDKFDPHVYSVDFEFIGLGPNTVAPAFDFCVSQIYFSP